MFITLSVHLRLQHVCRDAARQLGSSATADPCFSWNTEGPHGMTSVYLATTIHVVTTRAKDVLPNINHMQASKVTPGSDGMVPSAAAWRCLQQAHTIRMLPGVMGVHGASFVPVTLIFDLWPWHSNTSKQGTKHVSPVNLCKSVQLFRRYFSDEQKTNKKKQKKQKKQTKKTKNKQKKSHRQC